MKHKNLVIIYCVCIFIALVPIIYCLFYYLDIPNIKRNIDFTAVYDNESNNIYVEITNNTDDMAVTYYENYIIFKKENSVWYQIMEDKGLSLFRAECWIMPPYSGDNIEKVKFPAYKGVYDQDKKLESGLYKLQMRVNVYDSSQFSILSPENYKNDGTFTIKASPRSRSFDIETEFTVE